MKHRTGWSPEQGGSEDSPEDIPPGDDRSTVEVLRLLAADAKSYAETEMERQKLRVSLLGAAGRDAALLVLAALFLLCGALVALLVGIVLVLAPLVGPALATVIVIGATLLIVMLLLLVARARMRGAMKQAFGEDDRL